MIQLGAAVAVSFTSILLAIGTPPGNSCPFDDFLRRASDLCQ